MEQRLIPAREARVEITVVNSRFIATVAPVFAVDEAKVYTEHFAVTLQEAVSLSSAKRIFVWASVGSLVTKPLKVWLEDNPA